MRSLVDSYKCSLGLPTLGMFTAFHESDAGLDIRSRWGADRPGNKEAHPEGAWREQYRVMVQNSVAKPVAPRNSLSCRKPHRESTFGAYVPPLDNNGEIVERRGFMVPCETDSDCHTRCGDHPITGRAYVHTHNLQLYSYAGYGETSDEVLEGMLEAEEEAATKAAESAAATRKKLGSYKSVSDTGEACSNGWRRNFEGGCEARGMTTKDQRDPSYFTFDLPGDDKFDVQNHSVGVCTDVNIGYGHTGCDTESGAKAMMGFSGRSGRLFGWATVFCGVEIEVRGPDYVTDVAIAESSILFPRTLVPATSRSTASCRTRSSAPTRSSASSGASTSARLRATTAPQPPPRAPSATRRAERRCDDGGGFHARLLQRPRADPAADGHLRIHARNRRGLCL